MPETPNSACKEKTVDAETAHPGNSFHFEGGRAHLKQQRVSEFWIELGGRFSASQGLVGLRGCESARFGASEVDDAVSSAIQFESELMQIPIVDPKPLGSLTYFTRRKCLASDAMEHRRDFLTYVHAASICHSKTPHFSFLAKICLAPPSPSAALQSSPPSQSLSLNQLPYQW